MHEQISNLIKIILQTHPNSKIYPKNSKKIKDQIRYLNEEGFKIAYWQNKSGHEKAWIQNKERILFHPETNNQKCVLISYEPGEWENTLYKIQEKLFSN